jgi:hypothetical protein
MNEVFSSELLKSVITDRPVCDKCVKLTEYHLVDPHYGDEIWVDQCRCQSIWAKKMRIKDEKDEEIC